MLHHLTEVKPPNPDALEPRPSVRASRLLPPSRARRCTSAPRSCADHNPAPHTSGQKPHIRDGQETETDVQFGPLLQCLSQSYLLMVLFTKAKRIVTETRSN